MYRENLTKKRWILIILTVVVVNMSFALGILIGQRNSYNDSSTGSLEVKTEIGITKNIFSQIKQKAVIGLQEKPLNIGTLNYLIQKNKIDFELNIEANYTEIILGKDKKNIPLTLSLETMTNNSDGTDVLYNPVGQITLKKVGNVLSTKFYGSTTIDPLHTKQIVLKPLNKEDSQNMYLYNDKNIPEKLNNTSVPYFWIIL